MSRDSGNQTGGIFSTEYSNKIILLLLGVLILFVFLDFQARRKSGAVAAPAENSPAVLHPVLEPIRDKAETILGRPADSQSPALRPLTQGSAASGASREILRNGPVIRPVAEAAADEETFHLYFLRFKGNRLKSADTDLVRVTRPLPQGEVTLLDILARLQAGPLAGERGLLNAFDSSVKITDAYADRGIAYVHVDASIGRLGNHIIRDRVDQLTFTLTQFPQIQAVKLVIDGVPATSLGDGRVTLPDRLVPGSREVVSYP